MISLLIDVERGRVTAPGFRGWLRSCLAACLLAVSAQSQPDAPELRGWWADTFHAALRTPGEVNELVANARAGNFNAVFVEVRKRGDAYYESRYEPKATDVQAGFDPLAHLIARAHDTNAGPRLEVHAWIVAYNIWNRSSTLPPQPNHPFRLHPDWLTESFTGEQWDGANYAFDPGHPAVQQHTFNVAMDLVTRYDVDGLHLDYIRYGGRNWGYNPVAVARFNAATGRAGRPAPDDSEWMQWRREQVTGLVRRIYLAVSALKPRVKVTAATITWTPSAASFPSWLKTAAWSDVLQDWRGWMEEGILDVNVPMAYFRHETHAADFAQWSRFAKQHRFQRQVALGLGSYLNSISNAVLQMRSSRAAVSPLIPGADGSVVYSYANPAKDGVPRSAFLHALTQPSTNISGTPVFAQAAPPPGMPWKADQTLFGLGGVITDALTGQAIEGARVEVAGPAVVLSADANGAFGRLLSVAPTGAVVSAEGYTTQIHEAAGDWRRVVATNFALLPDTSNLRALDLRVTPGRFGAVVSWKTAAPARGRLLLGPGAPLAEGEKLADPRRDTRHSVFIPHFATATSAGDPPEFWGRVENAGEDAAGTNLSPVLRLAPARWPQLADEWSVRRTGAWDFVEAASGSYAGSWRTTTTTGNPTAVAVWTLTAEISGEHDLTFQHFPNTGSFIGNYEVQTSHTNFTVTVNHSRSGPLTGKLAGPLDLRRGERVQVRLTNRAPAGQTLVAAARVALEYRDDQDPPPAGQVPRWWAEHFFGEPTDPQADADGDGYSNEAEYAFGTDPTNADSHLRLRIESTSGGGWRLVYWPRAGGRTPVLERAPDVLREVWETVPVEPPWPRPLATGEWEIQLPPSDAGRQFYRFRASPAGP
ncbi:MAG: family 10 glycosylhydrolase [Verrucomicrobia bacterium]|nr:family 10 glycosylhydrolase [Verrucomicrobiota bacterium]